MGEHEVGEEGKGSAAEWNKFRENFRKLGVKTNRERLIVAVWLKLRKGFCLSLPIR